MKMIKALLNSQLQAFMAVADCKTVHAAARAIYISQTAVTQRILNLEAKLKLSLFIRTRQGMHLTSEGEKLLRYCKTVRDFSGETLAGIFKAGRETIQRVKISGPTSIMVSRIIPSCVQLMKDYKQLYIDFDINDTDDIVSSLRTGVSQFSILKPENVTQDMATKTLAPEKYLLLASYSWKKRKLKEILQSERIIDFDETDRMSLNYLQKYNLLKYIRSDRLFVNRTESLSKMLIEGYGYGVLTEEFSQPFLKNGELTTLNNSKTFDNTLSLCWYPRPAMPDYFAAIIHTI